VCRLRAHPQGDVEQLPNRVDPISILSRAFAVFPESEKAMVSISSGETYKFIDALRSMRSLVDQLIEIVNRFQLDESRKLVRSLQGLQKRTTVPQLKLAVLSDSQELKNLLIQSLLRTSLQDFSFPPLEVTCLYLAFGSEPECAVTLASGMTARLPVEELTEFVRNNGSASEFKKFLVRIPNEVLKAGVMVIDTPTLANTADGIVPSTKGALQEADACLLVVKDSDEISGSIAAFLDQAKSNLPKFFVILDSPAQGAKSSIRSWLEEYSGIIESRILSLPGPGLHPEEDFSGEDGLASLRTELMQFARLSSHKSMADELCTFASETLTHTEQAAASGRTMMLRAKLRRTVKQVSRICERSEELLAQTIDELPKTVERKNPIRRQESSSHQDQASQDAVAKGVEELLPSVFDAEPSLSAEPLVESAPEVPQPVTEPAIKSSLPAWQHSLRSASHFVPAKASPSVAPHPHFPPQDDLQSSSAFARTTNTRDSAALFARQSFTSGPRLVAPAVPAEDSYRAIVSTARSEAAMPVTAPPVLFEHSATPSEPTAADASSELICAAIETPTTSEAPITTPEEPQALIEIPAPLEDVPVSDFANAKRSSWEEATLPFEADPSIELRVLGSYGSKLGRHDNTSHGSAGHIALRVAAIAAVAASAWLGVLGFQRYQQSENTAKTATASTSLPQVSDDPKRLADSSSRDTSSSSDAIPLPAPSPKSSKAGADSASMTGVSSPKETIPGNSSTKGAIPRSIDPPSPQPARTSQSSSASTLAGADAITDPSLRLALDRWASSYRSGNVAEETASYAPFVDTYFNQKNMRPEQIARDRKNERSKIASVHEYRVTPLRITDQGNGQQAVLLQKDWNTTTTKGTNYSGSDLEKLVFVKIDNSWKIVEEQEVKVLKPKRG